MASIYPRGNKLYARYKDESGKWVSKPTPYVVGQERDAKRYIGRGQAAIDRRVADGQAQPSGPLTVRAYSATWLDDRRRKGRDWKTDRGYLNKHVLPAIGDLELAAVRTRDLIQLFQAVRATGRAPRTVYNIYSTIRAMFRDARVSELIEHSPCRLTADHLGACVDNDPEGLEKAVYTPTEAAALITDRRIPRDRQVLYALDFLAGVRHGEAAALRWRHLDPDVEPLGRLLVACSFNSTYNTEKSTKTQAVRRVPVHAVLAAILADWRAHGWVEMVGREPCADDLIVPLPPEAAQRRTSRAGEPFRSKNYAWKRFRDDLDTLGIPHRRMHDARATFITLCLDGGADPFIIETQVTHTRKLQKAFDRYDRRKWWARACEEVAKLSIPIPLESHETEHEFATVLATVDEPANEQALQPPEIRAKSRPGSASWTGAGPGLQNRWCSA